MEHASTYEPFMIEHSARELAGGSQPCLYLASSDFDAGQLPYDSGDVRIKGDHMVGAQHKEPTVRSRASSSQSHVLPTKSGTSIYSQDINTRPDSSSQRGHKKSSKSSLKGVDSTKQEGRQKQKMSSKKGHSPAEKVFKRSESFTAASQGGTGPIHKERRIRSQQGNIHEYQFQDELADSEIERMVLPPPPPLNIEGRGLDFDVLRNTAVTGEPGHQQLQMPPPNFTTDSVVSFQGSSQGQLHPQQEQAPSSPLAVIRRKRANQANWERTRKQSIPKTEEIDTTTFATSLSRKSAFKGTINISQVSSHTKKFIEVFYRSTLFL